MSIPALVHAPRPDVQVGVTLAKADLAWLDQQGRAHDRSREYIVRALLASVRHDPRFEGAPPAVLEEGEKIFQGLGLDREGLAWLDAKKKEYSRSRSYTLRWVLRVLREADEAHNPEYARKYKEA